MEGLWPGKERLGHLYLHYIENASPYGRVPLMVKVQLAEISTLVCLTLIFTSLWSVTLILVVIIF